MYSCILINPDGTSTVYGFFSGHYSTNVTDVTYREAVTCTPAYLRHVWLSECGDVVDEGGVSALRKLIILTSGPSSFKLQGPEK